MYWIDLQVDDAHRCETELFRQPDEEVKASDVSGKRQCFKRSFSKIRDEIGNQILSNLFAFPVSFDHHDVKPNTTVCTHAGTKKENEFCRRSPRLPPTAFIIKKLMVSRWLVVSYTASSGQ